MVLLDTSQVGGAMDRKRYAPQVMTKSEPTKTWAPFIAGGVGGMTAALFTSPLDVLKTRLQSNFYQTQLRVLRSSRGWPPPESLPFPRSWMFHFYETLQILKSIRQYEGWRGLFRGLGPNLVGIVPASAIKFYAYGSSKRMILNSVDRNTEPVWVHVSSAAIAGIATCTITNPIWLIKTRLQLDKLPPGEGQSTLKKRYRNSLDCFTQIVRSEGLRGLYKGMSASYLGVAESMMHWVLYEQAKKRLKSRQEQLVASGRASGWDNTITWLGQVSAAGSTKLFAAMAAYPHEVVRTRLRQAPTKEGNLKYTGVFQCFSLVWKEEGFAALYGGLTPHLLRVVPSTAIMFGVYELVIRSLHSA